MEGLYTIGVDMHKRIISYCIIAIDGSLERTSFGDNPCLRKSIRSSDGYDGSAAQLPDGGQYAKLDVPVLSR